ncbi:MAG: hypothetical protein E6R03_02275 [Hyphomicrobiaceae bacterium]|nr:MAG: hypothetical protein E6R03_02275 [Hyphomicrobiaceae bacterium]
MIKIKTLKLRNAVYINFKLETAPDNAHYDTYASEDLSVFVIRPKGKVESLITMVSANNVDYAILEELGSQIFHDLMDAKPQADQRDEEDVAIEPPKRRGRPPRSA